MGFARSRFGAVDRQDDEEPRRRAGWEWASRGTTATTLHAIAIWAWHAPALFDAAVINVPLHRLQHLSFFATAVLFWWSVLWRSDRGVAAWHLFLPCCIPVSSAL